MLFLLAFVGLLLLAWPTRVASYWIGAAALFAGMYILCVSASILVIITSLQPRISQLWLLLVVPVALAIGAFHANWMLFASGFRAYVMPGKSMENAIMIHEYVMGDSRYYIHRTPARGDIILFQKADYVLVKRVAAVGGDTIEGRSDVILLNGKQLEEPYIKHIGASRDYPEAANFGPVYVPAGKLFVLGDNRDISLDSRIRGYGLVDVAAVRGKVLYVLYSGYRNRMGNLIDTIKPDALKVKPRL